MRVAVVMGTRPEAIKLAPVARALDADPDFDAEVWVTGQHRAMLDQVTDAFGLDPAVQFVLPVHPNPNVSSVVNERLGHLDPFLLTEPLDHPTFVHLLERAALVITDSGGLPEEAPVFGVPVLVTRSTTEQIEGIDAGTAKLIGPDAEAIRSEAGCLLVDPAAMPPRLGPHRPMATAPPRNRSSRCSAASTPRQPTTGSLKP